MPKIIRTPRKKYVSKQYDDSWRTMSMVVDLGLLRRTENDYFLNSPYLQELYDLVHTNVLYNWLLGSYGDLDSAEVTYDAIKKVWRACASDHGFFARDGIVAQHYCTKELSFWRKVLYVPYLVPGSPMKKNGIDGYATYGDGKRNGWMPKLSLPDVETANDEYERSLREMDNFSFTLSDSEGSV